MKSRSNDDDDDDDDDDEDDDDNDVMESTKKLQLQRTADIL